jgi:hypothetical protein
LAGRRDGRIEVAEFESHAELKEWLSKKAPAFVLLDDGDSLPVPYLSID